MPILKKAAGRGGERGFSAVEALVSVVVLAVIVLLAVTVFQTSSKVSRSALMQGDSQQSSRVAIDLITRDLRSVGYDIDLGSGQQGLVYAGPWDVIFNANLNPTQDNFMAPGTPGAINVGLAPAAVPAGGPLYTPALTFTTGAETVRYTLDSNGDGVSDATDQGDDAEEGTPNPNDFVLHKQVYGVRPGGTNGGTGEPVAIVRGPVADQTGNLPTPLFQYWLDDDDDDATPEVLHGDASGDGELSQTEIAALTPVPATQLALVTRSVIVVTTEDGESTGRGDYRTRQVMSSVSYRNYIRRTAVIAGIVYQDADADGEYDAADDVGIPSVTVRLSTGDAVVTGADGTYVFEISPGVYTVTEFDPAGYVSTSPNTASVTASTGVTTIQNFGDRPGFGVGEIVGTVYYDMNENQLFETDEPGISNVVITLHTGVRDTTDTNGDYYFQVPVGTYTVVEADSAGWGSTTSNSVEVILAVDGGVEKVYFGDIPAVASGTIRGTVYLDTDGDGVMDGGEGGIPDVPIVISGRDSTVTDGNGLYSVSVPVGLHSVKEYDLAGYSSSTPNSRLNVLVLPDSTVTIDFGDVYEGSTGFTVVTIGSTNRALSITAVDLKEDSKGDPDIILGTQLTTGTNNLHVWHNKRNNSGTAITALFNAAPTFSRAAGGPIPALQLVDINSDATMDLVTGLDLTAANNLKLWQTITTGGSKGMYPTTPNYSFPTSTGRTVRSLATVYWPTLSDRIYLVGTKATAGTGVVEVWRDAGSGAVTHLTSFDLTVDGNGALGEVSSLASGDFNGDGYTDIAVGQDKASYQGRLTIFLADPNLMFRWVPSSILPSDGAVSSLVAVNMAEDDQNDMDLLVGTSKALGSGVVQLWLNSAGSFGTPDSVSGSPIVSDWISAGGEVLAMATAKLDNDIFPDLIAGLRTAAYAGRLDVYRTTGYLPSTGTEWSSPGSGELVTLTLNDFNIDGKKDVAVGTRTAASTGQLIVYFGQ